MNSPVGAKHSPLHHTAGVTIYNGNQVGDEERVICGMDEIIFCGFRVGRVWRAAVVHVGPRVGNIIHDPDYSDY